VREGEKRLNKRDVLNAGHVKLLEFMGGDEAVIRNARLCWRSEDRSNPQADRNLIRHLITKGHWSPFEAMVFTFKVKAPIFVARQWMRHRIGSFNEESLRYCVAEGDFYVPDGLTDPDPLTEWYDVLLVIRDFYERLLKEGDVPKEQARAILPLGIYTKFYWTVNGSSLMNFLRLRIDPSAQKEIRDYAEVILEMVKEVAPMSFSMFEALVLK